MSFDSDNIIRVRDAQDNYILRHDLQQQSSSDKTLLNLKNKNSNEKVEAKNKNDKSVNAHISQVTDNDTPSVMDNYCIQDAFIKPNVDKNAPQTEKVSPSGINKQALA